MASTSAPLSSGAAAAAAAAAAGPAPAIPTASKMVTVNRHKYVAFFPATRNEWASDHKTIRKVISTVWTVLRDLAHFFYAVAVNAVRWIANVAHRSAHGVWKYPAGKEHWVDAMEPCGPVVPVEDLEELVKTVLQTQTPPTAAYADVTQRPPRSLRNVGQPPMSSGISLPAAAEEAIGDVHRAARLSAYRMMHPDSYVRHSYCADGVGVSDEGVATGPVRTGLRGTGSLWQRGPNQAGDALVLSWNESTHELEFLEIVRRRGDRRAIPGGFREFDWAVHSSGKVKPVFETGLEAARREANEETNLDLPLARWTPLCSMYSPDGRNTEEAWVETAAGVVFMTPAERAAYEPKAGDDAKEAKWVAVTEDLLTPGILFAGHPELLRRAVEFVANNEAAPVGARAQARELLEAVTV